MKFCRWMGIIIQAIVIGTLLFVAVVKLTSAHTDARIFQYQGF